MKIPKILYLQEYYTFISEYLVFHGEAKYQDASLAQEPPEKETKTYKDIDEYLFEGSSYNVELTKLSPDLDKFWCRVDYEIGGSKYNFVNKLEQILNDLDKYYAESGDRNGDLMVDVPRKKQPVTGTFFVYFCTLF